jgi:predicted transcriptional regulator
VLVAKTDNTVPEVFGRLIREGYLGCPVIDKTTHEFKGFIDMLQLVTHWLNNE